MFSLISLMIIVGGLTRLTEVILLLNGNYFLTFSTVGEQQWLKYYELYKLLPEFKILNYDMTMNEFKVIFWWEWTHRMLLDNVFNSVIYSFQN